MTTVTELIEALQKLPGHTEVKVLEYSTVGYENVANWIDLEIGEYSDTYDFIDLKDNPFCDEEQRKRTPTLDLGSTKLLSDLMFLSDAFERREHESLRSSCKAIGYKS